MDFATALKSMRANGMKLTRTSWGDNQRLVEVRMTPLQNTVLEYEELVRSEKIFADGFKRLRLPYYPTPEDIMAYDWEFEARS